MKNIVPSDTAFNLAKRIWQQTENHREVYIWFVQEILTAFQMLEESMKVYLEKTFSRIRSILGKKAVFKYTIKDVDGMSLRKLLHLFRKYNSNTRLQERIQKSIKVRNQYAHKGFILHYSTSAAVLNQEKWLTRNIVRCKKLLPQILNLVREVNKEAAKL